MTGPLRVKPLRVNRLHYPVESLGYGRRLGIWVQGCELACAGCVAQDTWPPTGGELVDVDQLVWWWQRRYAGGADGLTVSGGEPLAQPEAVGALLAGVRRVSRDPDRPADILVYTGYELAELDPVQQRALSAADVVVTGRYRADLPTDLALRGSGNQRLVLRTGLGRQRYAELVDAPAASAPIQYHMDEHGVLGLVGIPRRGDLARLERGLRAGGATVGWASWRPARRAGPAIAGPEPPAADRRPR